MIIKVDSALIEKQINAAFAGIDEVLKPMSKDAISKAIFAIAGRDFIKHMNKVSISNKKSYFHLYEWGKVGSTKDKLFEIRRVSSGRGEGFKIVPYFIESKTPVPIPRQLRTPGKSGRFVSKKFVFREKAQVMELGNPIRPFSSKRGPNSALVMVGKDGKPFFIRYPRTASIKNPGGKSTTGSFFKQFETWFSNPVNIENALDNTAYFKSLEHGIARVLNRHSSEYASKVREEIINISGKYSKGISEL